MLSLNISSGKTIRVVNVIHSSGAPNTEDNADSLFRLPQTVQRESLVVSHIMYTTDVLLAGAATSITFVATKPLSQQRFCHDKHVFVSTIACLSRQNVFFCDKYMLVAAKLLLRQNYVCRDKYVLLKLL